MDFTDEGIFISAKPLGEANAIAEILTAAHGRHLGLVRGGRSRRLRPCCNPAISCRCRWRARLADHLGGFAVELIDPLAARVLDDQAALAAIGSLTSLAKLLPERDPHPELYHGALQVLRALDDAEPLAGAPCALGDDAAPGSRLRPRFERLRRDRRHDATSPSSRRARAAPCRATPAKPMATGCSSCRAFLVEEEADASPQDVVAGSRAHRPFPRAPRARAPRPVLPQSRERLIGLVDACEQSTALP